MATALLLGVRTDGFADQASRHLAAQLRPPESPIYGWPVANDVQHFAVAADDVERARRFYEAVFGWRFEA